MRANAHSLVVFGLLAANMMLAGCGDKDKQRLNATAPAKHEHIPPHHGTPVVLGNEEYHLELVLDAPSGKLQAYVMDGELDNFIRIPQSIIKASVRRPEREETLEFKGIANNATGEAVGDTSLFEAGADWLKTTPTFDATIEELIVRGKMYQNVKFNFPKGNDSDEPAK